MDSIIICIISMNRNRFNQNTITKCSTLNRLSVTTYQYYSVWSDTGEMALSIRYADSFKKYKPISTNRNIFRFRVSFNFNFDSLTSLTYADSFYHSMSSLNLMSCHVMSFWTTAKKTQFLTFYSIVSSDYVNFLNKIV